MRLSHNHILTFLFLILLQNNCAERYDIDTDNNFGLLVLDGGISDQPGPYFINLSTTRSATRKPDPLPGAAITISDDKGNSESLNEIELGKYKLEGLIVKGRPNGVYKLNIELSDGRKFESTPEIMAKDSTPVDSYSIQVIKEKVITPSGIESSYWMVKVYLDTQLPETDKTSFYRWSVAEVWLFLPTCTPGAISCPRNCYIFEPNTTYNLVLLKSSDYALQNLRNLSLLSRGIDISFSSRHYFNITQHSINSNAYQYWSKVEQLISKRGSIFDSPPATIIGNIKNISNPNEPVFGYFEVSATQLRRIYIDRGQIPTFVETCIFGAIDFDPSYQQKRCFFCEALEGSTVERPAWFKL